MKTRLKEIIIGSVAIATIAMPITWFFQYSFMGKQPSLYYILEYVIFVITLAAIECIAAYIKKKDAKKT